MLPLQIWVHVTADLQQLPSYILCFRKLAKMVIHYIWRTPRFGACCTYAQSVSQKEEVGEEDEADGNDERGMKKRCEMNV